ncbi:hypothetical protein X738_17345 [Mesorhizobium sp. LNHC209A00]|nr:hypothetical protein X738_17345 [Mesorhizobium sp. LNHC209A00]
MHKIGSLQQVGESDSPLRAVEHAAALREPLPGCRKAAKAKRRFLHAGPPWRETNSDSWQAANEAATRHEAGFQRGDLEPLMVLFSRRQRYEDRNRRFIELS